jgi:hypothetical protein
MHDARESGNPTQRPADAFANLREEYGAYFDAIPDVDAFVREQRGGEDAAEWLDASGAPAALEARNWQRVNMPGAPTSPYTLTPWPESVDKRLARLDLELSRLREANDYLAGRVAALEADGRTWRDTLEAHGDALQTLMLRGKA